MALLNKKEELLVTWRALGSQVKENGWSTIAVSTETPCRVLAGRHFPGNQEALLFGFRAVRVPPTDQLPQGHGFLVSKAEPREELDCSYVWIALCRQYAGSLDLFVTMAEDIVLTLNELKHLNDDGLFHVFLSRIRAWQSFMHHGKDDFLSPEKEVGLFGELEFLQEVLTFGLPATTVIDGWQGPFDGVHDFKFGNGAVEVKTTLSPIGFKAQINSLEQLDDQLVQPLFLAGIRLALNVSGITLPEKINNLRNILSKTPEALAMFNSALLNVGFIEDNSNQYSRRFLSSEKRLLHVFNDFPRITCADINIEIRKVKYELDLDMIAGFDVDFLEVLYQLKAI